MSRDDACPSFQDEVPCEPPGWEWVSLSEALTWIAFFKSVDRQRLSGALRKAPAGERAAASDQLQDALNRLLDLGRKGTIQMTGQFSLSPETSLPSSPRSSIAARDFKEYRKYEVDCDGIRRWHGHIIDFWKNPPAELRSDEIFILIEVKRKSLVENFPPPPIKGLSIDEVIEWCKRFIADGLGNGMDKAWPQFQNHPRRMGMSRESFRDCWKTAKEI